MTIRILNEVLLFSCLAAFVTGIVLAAATMLTDAAYGVGQGLGSHCCRAPCMTYAGLAKARGLGVARLCDCQTEWSRQYRILGLPSP